MPVQSLVLAGLEGLALKQYLTEAADKAGQATRVLDQADEASAATEALTETDILVLGLPLADGMVQRGFAMVNAAKAAGPRHIILLSRYGAAHDAHWRLGRETGRIDLAVEQSGIPFTILRPNTLMNTAFTLPPKGQEVIRVPNEDARISYLHPEDLCACITAVANAPEAHAGRTYAVTGPEALSPPEAIALVAGAAGSSLRSEQMEEEEYMAVLEDEGRSKWEIDMLVSLSRISRRGMMGNVTGAVNHLTGYEAQPFSAFAQRTWG